jgi:hypothetical protein
MVDVRVDRMVGGTVCERVVLRVCKMAGETVGGTVWLMDVLMVAHWAVCWAARWGVAMVYSSAGGMVDRMVDLKVCERVDLRVCKMADSKVLTRVG